MPRNYKKSTNNPRQPGPDPDDLLEMLKEIKIDKKSALSVAKNHNIGKSSLYDIVKDYDQKMGKDDVTVEKLNHYIQSYRKTSGGQTVS